MTRERAKELLPVIQAYAEGKEVEWQNAETPQNWVSSKDPQWCDWCDYRVKPEPSQPEEFWCLSPYYVTFATKADAEAYVKSRNLHGTPRLFREVVQ